MSKASDAALAYRMALLMMSDTEISGTVRMTATRTVLEVNGHLGKNARPMDTDDLASVADMSVEELRAELKKRASSL